VFRARDVLADGVLTPAELRSSAWRRLYRGVYVDSSLPDGVDLRIRGASLLVPAAAVFTGRTAAWLHGALELADVQDPVEVTVPMATSFGPVCGLRVATSTYIRWTSPPCRGGGARRGWPPP
jgi:hypothetical protein